MAQGRRVRRIVRKFDTWSVMKVSLLFYLSLLLIVLLAGIMLWLAGGAVGAVDSMERFMRGVGFSGFRFVSIRLLEGTAAAGLALVALATGMTVLAAVIYNLISDVVGGIQVTVLEEAMPPAAPEQVAPEVGAASPAAVPQKAAPKERCPAPAKPKSRAG